MHAPPGRSRHPAYSLTTEAPPTTHRNPLSRTDLRCLPLSLLGCASPVWKNLGTAPFTGVPGRADLIGGAAATALSALGEATWDTIFDRAAACPLEEAALTAGSPDKLALAASGQDAAAAHQLPLTRREREVAELVAQGLSNREIAERLFLSIRTVDSHLEHIYKKLGLSSRVKLTAWIREQAVS